jgi:hypothetical protein
MRLDSRSIWILALLLAVPGLAAAETYTVTLDNGHEILTRYQPKVSQPDETKVMLLTENGNWIAIARSRVVSVTSNTETSGFGRMINNTTIALGLSPNDVVDDSLVPTDPTTALLNMMAAQNSQPQRDYSVQQFVNTEDAGKGGFPANFGTGVSNSRTPAGFYPPGGLVTPAPAPPPAAPVGDQ